ncbi:hypothetical protein GCM10027085_41590 [Spirosoma aerophilum]
MTLQSNHGYFSREPYKVKRQLQNMQLAFYFIPDVFYLAFMPTLDFVTLITPFMIRQ